MTRIEYAPSTRGDFERIVKHLIAVRHPDPALRIAEIVHAIEVLHTTPMIGRPSSGSLRELIIGRGAHGYVARYRYVRAQDIAYVLSAQPARSRISHKAQSLTRGVARATGPLSADGSFDAAIRAQK